MPPPAPPEKLSVVVFSGDPARVHYAFAMAAAAAAIERATTLFFTMEALTALRPGWATAEAEAAREARGIATFEELVAAVAALGVRLIVCEMGLRAVGLTRAELRSDLALEEAGIVTFLNDARADGAMLFV